MMLNHYCSPLLPLCHLRQFSRYLALASFLTWLLLVQAEHAFSQQVRYWRGSSAGDITNPNNWALESPFGPPSGYSPGDYFTITDSLPGLPGTFSQGTHLSASGFNYADGHSIILSQDNSTLQLAGPYATIRSSGSFSGSLTIQGGTIALNPTTLNEFFSNNSLVTNSPIVGSAPALAKSGAGTVTLGGTNTFSAPILVQQGTLRVNGHQRLGSSTNLTVDPGATFDLAGFGQTLSGLSGSGNVTNAGNLMVGNNNTSSSFGGSISGSGGLTKIGAGTLTLSGANTYNGQTQIFGGTIALSGNERIANSSHVYVDGAGTLMLNGTQETIGNLSGQGLVNLNNNAALYTGGNNTNTTFLGNISGNGTLRKQGIGAMTLVNPNSLTGSVRVDQGTLRMAGNNLLTNLTTSGIGLGIGPGGTFDVNTTSQTIGLVGNDGMVNLSGGSLNATNYSNFGTTNVGTGQLSGQILANFAGGFVNVGTGGALQSNTIDNHSGAIIHLDPGAFVMSANVVNNGTINGDFQINLGQTLSGGGTAAGEVTVFNGGVLAPGNSVDTITIADLKFGPGGKLDFELADANGTAGIGWDAVNVSNTLEINATTASPIEIHLISYDSLLPQSVSNFDAAQNYSWTFLTAAGGISGFAADLFTVNTNDFAASNPFTGAFHVQQNGGDLNLVYLAAVPEPGTAAALVAVGAVWLARRRRVR